MADPYDPDDEQDELTEQREQDSYDQEEAAQQQQLMQLPADGDQTFDFNGQPVTQAIPTAAPQPQAPQQVQQQFETFDYNPTGEPPAQQQQQAPQQPAQQQQQAPQQPAQQQPQQRPLAPYPGGGMAQRPARRDRAAAEREARFGTIISDEAFDASPDVKPQPTGGVGTQFKIEGHRTLSSAVSALEWALEKGGFDASTIKSYNAEYKKYIEEQVKTLSPEGQLADQFSVFNDAKTNKWSEQSLGALAQSYFVFAAVGLAGGIGPGLAAKAATTLAAKTLLRTGAETAARAGTGAAVTGFAGTGATLQVGQAYDALRETFAKASPEEMDKVPAYKEALAEGYEDKVARERAAFKNFSGGTQALIGAAGNVGLGLVFPRTGFSLPTAATRAGNVGREAGAGAAALGGQMAGGEAASQSDLVNSGFQQDIDWGRVGVRGVAGAGFGAAVGAAGGAFRAGRPPEPVRPPAADPGTTSPPASPMLALPPPARALPAPDPMLALPAPEAMPGRRETVTPSGVPPEHAAALNAAGIGRQAIEVEPGAQQFRPPSPEVRIGQDETFFAPPPRRYDLPAGTVLPPADPSAWTPQQRTGPEDFGVGAPSRPAAAALPTGPDAFGVGAPVERQGYYPGAVAPHTPPLLEASRQRGDGFVVQPPPPYTGPQDFGVGAPPRPAAPAGPATPPPGPEGFGVGAPATDRPGYYPGAVQPRTPPLLEAARDRGAGFTMQEPAAAPAQLTASRERGEGFTTEPATPAAPAAPPLQRPEPRPSEGLSANQLDQRLADYGLSKQQRSRLVGKEKKAAALDKLEQETRARGEEPPRRGVGAQREKEPTPAAPRGAEAREQPTPAARPSEGMSHKELGEALQKLGLSRQEVNKFVNRVQRAIEYDRIKRGEEATLERLRNKGRETEGVTPANDPENPDTVRTTMKAGPDETKGHPAGEREDAAWRKLKPTRTAGGTYKGAPEWVKKPRHLEQLRDLMRQLVKEGVKGRYWYEESARKIIQITRGNLADAERMMGLVAIYSPQTRVFTNMTMAIRAYDQWKRGETISVKTDIQDAKAEAWLNRGEDWGGRKTPSFYLNLMHELVTMYPEVTRAGNVLNIPPDVLTAIKGATVDLWVLRALGHQVDAAGGEGGVKGVAAASDTDKYGFSQLEIRRLAGELNLNVPVGEQRWLPHQVQAALWSAIKARYELKSVKEATWKDSLAANFATMEPNEKGVLKRKAPDKNGPARVGHMGIWRGYALAADPAAVARQVETAMGSFGDAVERVAQHITVEAIPSKDLNHPIFNASREARDQFTREAAALITDENGTDLVAEKLGVNLGYRTYGSGSFEGRVNPNIVTTLVPEKPAGFFDAVKARQYARAVQYIFRQDAVPIFRGDRAHKFGPDFYLVDKEGNRVTDDKGRPLNRFRTQGEAQAAADQRGDGTTIQGGKIAHGARLVFKEALDEATEQRLLAAIRREINHDDAGFTRVNDNEVVLINYRGGDDGLPFIAEDRAFANAVDRIVADPDIGAERVTHFGSEGEYGPVQDWTRGSDAARALAADAGGSPAFQRWLQDRHEAFGKLLDDWSDPEARLAAGAGDGRGGGRPDGRSTLELPQARAPPDPSIARERREGAAERRAAEVDATPEAEPPVPELGRGPDASRDQRNQPTAATSPLSRVMQDERVNAPVRAAVEAGGGLHSSLRAIADSPHINKRLPHVAAYARSLLRLAPDLEVRRSDQFRRGAYVSDDNLATGTRSERIEVTEPSVEVMLHEATHATAGRFIDNLEPGSREMRVLQTIRDEFERGAQAAGRSGDDLVAYALSNPHELHAMLRTSPELHELMRGIAPGAEYRARMAQLGYPVGSAKSLWQSFVRFIRQALKLPQNVTSLMDHVMRPLDDITEAGARFRDTPGAAYRPDSMVYRDGWDRQPLVARTEHELPSFSDARAWAADKLDPQGVRGNYTSGMRRAIRQAMPTEQLAGFHRHLFNPSTGGDNLLDTLVRAKEGVERVSREYGDKNEAAVRAAIKKLEPEINHVLTMASRVDANPAHPPDHPLNSHSRATPVEFQEIQDAYKALTPAHRQVVTETFNMTRQQRVDRGDAAMRGIGKAYLEGVTDTQVETMVRQMRTMEGVNELLSNDTNPVARAFGDQWVGNRDFVKAIAAEWKRGWINNYVPLHRSGDWVVTYTDPASGEAGMLSRYTIREAEAARQQLIKEGAEPSLVLSRERLTPSDIPRLTIVDKFEAKLSANKSLSPDQVTAARDLLAKVLLDQSRFAGTMRKRLGVHGADPAKLSEAMAQSFMALKNAMGHLDFGPQYEAALGGMRRHVGEMGRGAATARVNGEAPTSADVRTAQQILEEMQRRKPVSEDPHNILLRGAHNATFATYLHMLASPAQTIMNGIETYMQGIPRIGAQFGVGRATTAMARASAEIMPRQLGRGIAGTAAVARRSLDQGEWNSGQQIRDHLIAGSRKNDAAGITALFQRLQDGNLIGYSSYRDLQNMAKGGSGKIRKLADWAADFTGILHSKMEDANRAVTALAAYDVHLQRHGNRAAAVDYAERILRTSAPNFNLSNKPRFATAQGGFGAWGIPLAQFRQHGMWAYSQMALDIRNAFKGADAATRKEAGLALIFTIGMQTVLLGTLNWLADPLRYLWGAYDALTGGTPQNHSAGFRRAAASIFGVTGGELVSRGLSRGFGYGPNLSNRVGMNNPLGIPEFQGSYTNPRDVTANVLMAIAGAPAISSGSQIITGYTNFAAGNYMQAVSDILPKILRDPFKAGMGESVGTTSRRGRVLQTPEQISMLDTVYSVIGFQSARQGERTERQGTQHEFVAQVTASRSAATKQAAEALVNGSASERRAAKQAIDEHNARYPGSKIDPKDVFAYRKREIERLRDPTLSGMTVAKAMRPAVRDAGAFANY